MFAKYWRAGEVKTRLGATIGLSAAARVHHQLVRTSLQRFRKLGEDRVLVFSPPDQAEAFAGEVDDTWRLEPQTSGDLGARIAHFFRFAFSAGASRALLIGSDSPSLPTAYLQQAFDLLRENDVVLGPAEDGGYYLIGLKAPCEELFADIAWSTSDVLSQTLTRCETLGLRTSQAPTWYDVDNRADLKRLLADLARDDANLDSRTLYTELTTILADCPPL